MHTVKYTVISGEGKKRCVLGFLTDHSSNPRILDYFFHISNTKGEEKKKNWKNMKRYKCIFLHDL